MSSMKDKLIEIAKKAMVNNAWSDLDADDYVRVYVDESEWDYTCNEIADKIIANLPDILANSEWVKLKRKKIDVAPSEGLRSYQNWNNRD